MMQTTAKSPRHEKRELSHFCVKISFRFENMKGKISKYRTLSDYTKKNLTKND